MFRKFIRDTSANVVISAALMAPPMFMAVGVGMDMAERYRATQSYQAAVDAAALATAKVMNDTGDADDAKAYGAKVFKANIANLHQSTGTITIDTGNGDCSTDGIVATANLHHPMFFDGMHKYFAGQGDSGYMNISVSSTVECGNSTVEIALVLDNSGSMGNNGKLTQLKTSAKKLVQKFHQSMSGGSKVKPIQFGLVPFSSMVNVGNSSSIKNASWMDTQGISPIHNEHLDWESNPDAYKVGFAWKAADGTALTRFRLYDEMDISWAGCVEQRPYPHHTTDAEPTTSNPATLIVPSFAPDTPDNYSGERETSIAPGGAIYCTQWFSGRWRGYCYRWSDGRTTWSGRHPTQGYADRYGGDYASNGSYIGSGSSYTYGSTIYEQTYENNYISDAHNTPDGMHHLDPNNSGTGTGQYSRQRWTWKYFNDPNTNVSNVRGLPGGPNAWCTSKPILPLTTNQGHAISAIENMVATGATNVQQGVAWGWKLLSKGEPFTQGRDYNVADNRKIMIVMTDGNNTYYPMDEFSHNVSTRNPAYYSSFGHNGGKYSTPLTRRIFEGFTGIANPSDSMDAYRQAMDSHLLETCTNAKAAGVQIFTIAFDVPNGSSVKSRLQQCSSVDSSGAPQYYDAQNNTALDNAFKDIYNKVSELAITH